MSIMKIFINRSFFSAKDDLKKIIEILNKPISENKIYYNKTKHKKINYLIKSKFNRKIS